MEVADLLTRLDDITDAYQNPLGEHVTVRGHDIPVVGDLDPIPVAGRGTRERHRPRRGRPDRRIAPHCLR